MGYKVALEKSWEALQGSEKKNIRFLNDEYEIDFFKKSVLSLSCNVEAKEYYKILILHYLANEHKVSNIDNDKWISFKDLEGGKEYFSAFRKRAIEPILRKYENSSKDISIQVFPKIKVQVKVWAKDDEFDADCNMLFNENIKAILSTEDTAVLGGIVASQI
ncbi:MAG: DUF3786 domain-containing protein [Candidatus Omnitrophica bacterium]|nr:DUF3786 domain-containing protein [Candidatus Omnitrophota bacterium]